MVFGEEMGTGEVLKFYWIGLRPLHQTHPVQQSQCLFLCINFLSQLSGKIGSENELAVEDHHNCGVGVWI